MSTFTSYSRRIVTAAAGIGVLGAGMATSAFAAPAVPAVPNASDVPVPVLTRPVDASGGLLGIPRGSIPGLGTPDMGQVPMLSQLPQLEVVPLPQAEASPEPVTSSEAAPAESATQTAPTQTAPTQAAPAATAPQRTSGGSALAGLDDAGFMSGLTKAVPAG